MMLIALKEAKALVILEYEHLSSFLLAFLFVLHDVKCLPYIYSLIFQKSLVFLFLKKIVVVPIYQN